ELTACGGVARGYTPFGAFGAYLNVGWAPEIGHSEASGSPGASQCVTTTSVPTTGTWCFTLTNSGDSDFDGPTYNPNSWPPGTNGPASAMQITSPTGTGFAPTSSNQLYTHMRFTAGSGGGATDANGAPFYPYYSFLQPAGSPPGQGCSLVLGNFAQGSNNSV